MKAFFFSVKGDSLCPRTNLLEPQPVLFIHADG
jgi:hypothetical protein